MPTSLIEGNSLLAVDIGAANTRVAYFDVVEGKYRLIGVGESPTTLNAPIQNVTIGFQLAVESLQAAINRLLLDEDGRLIVPSQPDGSGVDSVVTTISAGPVIKTLVVGLLSDVSLKSIENLALTTYTRVVDTIGLSDKRRPEEQLNAIVRQTPELILIAGGINGGATTSLQKSLELIGLSAYLLPESKRPAVLYAGNQDLAKDVQSSLNNIVSSVHVSANVRPTLNVEDLVPSQRELADVVIDIRQHQLPELNELRALAGGRMLPASYARGRMVRFLSSYFGTSKGVLSVDVGAGSLAMGLSFSGDLHLNVYPQFGVGEALAGLSRYTDVNEIARWLPMKISAETVRDYLYQKSIYPQTIPATAQELAIEQAIVRQVLYLASRSTLSRLPANLRPQNGLLPPLEPIIASGASITAAPTSGQALLMLLDGLQPVGITTLAVDQSNILAMLGAAGELNNILPIQVIEAGALAYLATVVSPVSAASFGTPILRAKLIDANGKETTCEVKTGDLQVLPLENGRSGRLQLRPLQRADVGLGPGRAGEVDVSGSAIGIVIDARGRPVRLPSDLDQAHELVKKWLLTVGG